MRRSLGECLNGIRPRSKEYSLEKFLRERLFTMGFLDRA